MESISILSLLSFFICSIVGAYWHYRKVCKEGRHMGGLLDYLVADHPGRSGMVGFALFASAWTAATSGVADFINPQALWNLLLDGNLHIPSVNIIILAVTSGYSFDSLINKGGNE